MPDASTPPSIVRRLALTATDLVTIDRLAQRMIVAGLWLSAHRLSEPHCDCVEIATHAITDATLSIGVLASGRYFYMDHRTSGVHLGDDLDDVLTQAGLSFAD
jgi:2C-methyl-D-erythritol 2,4-cyclodiphosphate synthase